MTSCRSLNYSSWRIIHIMPSPMLLSLDYLCAVLNFPWSAKITRNFANWKWKGQGTRLKLWRTKILQILKNRHMMPDKTYHPIILTFFINFSRRIHQSRKCYTSCWFKHLMCNIRLLSIKGLMSSLKYVKFKVRNTINKKRSHSVSFCFLFFMLKVCV